MPKGKHGNHSRGKNHYRWNDKKIVSSHGYIRVRVGKDHHLSDPHGYAYEHRIVAEKVLGRRLGPNDVVHHIDGDKTNNTPDNLRVEPRGIHSIVTHPRRRGLDGCFEKSELS